MPVIKNFFYYSIWILIPAMMSGMDSNDCEAMPMSSADLENKLSTLHERPTSTPYKKEISESMHFLFAEGARSKVTHFCPVSEQECDHLIERVCSKPEKIWWFITPSTKKFNLEEKLKKKGLAPYPLPAMACALVDKKFDHSLSSDLSISLGTQSHMWTCHVFQNNAVVSKGSLLFQEKWVGIHDVETEVGHRKKGYATLVLKFLLNHARECGATHAVLESSPEAYNLYKKLGFKEIFQTIIYYRE